MSKITLEADDALWLIGYLPSLNESHDAQRQLRVMTAVGVATGHGPKEYKTFNINDQFAMPTVSSLVPSHHSSDLNKDLYRTKPENLHPNEPAVMALLEGHWEKKVDVIKIIRHLTGLGLKEAKDAMEGNLLIYTHRKYQDLAFSYMSYSIDPSLNNHPYKSLEFDKMFEVFDRALMIKNGLIA